MHAPKSADVWTLDELNEELIAGINVLGGLTFSGIF